MNEKIILIQSTFNILKRDYEKDIALLQNNETLMYNVAIGINKQLDGWKCSLLYTIDKEEAEQCYLMNLYNSIFLEKAIAVDYVMKLNNIGYHAAKEIVDVAYSIYLKEDDIIGSRITLEDICYFLVKLNEKMNIDKIKQQVNIRDMMIEFFEKEI